MLGVVLDRASWDCGDIDVSALETIVPRWRWYDNTRDDETASHIAGAALVVTNKIVLSEALIREVRDLRLICVTATGVNNIDIEGARRLGIAVCNVTGYATASVVQHTFALMLALVTRLPQYQRDVAAGRWQRSAHFCLLDHPIWELAGRTLGIVGYGTLGRAVAEVARGFGMKVLVASRTGRAQADRVPLRELLPQADVLSVHCPLTAETRGLIGAHELSLMNPHALLINTARGGIVDEDALAQALRAGKLGGAGVDVLSVEPPAQGNPLLAPDIPRLIVTPHIAWASREARQRLIDEVVENIRAFLAGVPRNRVA